MPTSNDIKPFIRWPGGKSKLALALLSLLPKDYNHYYEPFLGGGALYFHLLPTKSTLSDINPELINAYLQVRDNPKALIKELKKYKNDMTFYYDLRAKKFNNNIKRAARFIYLTKTSFNGIYRENKKGIFNVPYGYRENIDFIGSSNLLKVSNSLLSADIRCSHYSDIIANSSKNDFVYFDPPYTLKKNNGYSIYKSNLFTWDDQLELAEIARGLKNRGVFVMVSNSPHESVKKLYKGFKLIELERLSLVSAYNRSRGKITETVFISY